MTAKADKRFLMKTGVIFLEGPTAFIPPQDSRKILHPTHAKK